MEKLKDHVAKKDMEIKEVEKKVVENKKNM